MSAGSSGGSGVGSSANVFEPPGQGTAATNWNAILQPMINQSLAGTSPGAAYYPQAQQATQQYITQNPAASTYYGTAQQAPGIGAGIQQTAAGDISQLQGLTPALGYNAFNPQYGSDIQAAGFGSPAYGTAAAGSNAAAAGGQNLMGAAGQVLSTGFDPQQALYNQQSSNALNNQNAINAMSGVAGSPYGAAVTGQNQQLFNQNWLNQALGRQEGALGAAAPAYSAGQALTQAPLNTQNNQLGFINQLLNSANTAGSVGANALGALDANSLSLGTGGLQALLGGGAAPYNASNTIGQTDLSALGNLVQLGNSQYQLPESVLGNLQSYMGLGQSASSLANQIDAANAQGQSGTFQGLGTLGGLGIGAYNANTLANAVGGSGGGSGSWLASLFSGGVSDPILAALGPFAS